MHEAILKFADQLSFKPEIKNGPVDSHGKKIVFAGMGGSHLAADLFKLVDPRANIFIHKNYGLPTFTEEELRESLFIASSFSGNTEETLDFLDQALSQGARPAVIASGGKLLMKAQSQHLPFVQIPDTIIQPRLALGVSFIALCAILDREDLVNEAHQLSRTFDPASYESEGKRISGTLKGFVPIIYASVANEALANNWKIKINETAKSPAFTNVFPELNHNEMTGFSHEAGAQFKILMLRDSQDHPRIEMRMTVTAQLLRERGVESVETELSDGSVLLRALGSIITADWTALHLAEKYGVDPAQVPLVEEFKRRIAE